MRTSSHVCRVLINGYRPCLRLARLPRPVFGDVGRPSYTSNQFSTTSWQRLEEVSRDEQSRSAVTFEQDTIDWITKCDSFLPLELRSKTWQDNLSDFNGVRSPELLPQLLADSDDTFPHGILAHIALTQRRWSAALFLCQALFRYENKPALKTSNLHKGSPWSSLKAAGPLVDVDFFQKPVNFWNITLFQDGTNSSHGEPPLDYIARTSFLEQDQQALLWKSAMGQIWRCIGHAMLAATRENSPLQIDMVGFVLQVIASMHSDGVIPEEIYMLESSEVPSSSRKPPFLHLMSSRIMTALSDTMWKKTEPDLMRDVAYVVARHAHKGSKSPAGENGPRLQALKHEVWLELVLWGCVHNGHYHEGVELLRSMFSVDPVHRWKTVPWSDLEILLEAKLLAQEDQQKARSWYRRLASSMEGYSQEQPIVSFDRNTISREVVARLCDGMLSSPQLWSHRKDQPAILAENLVDVLDIANRSATETSTNSLLHRVFDRSIENVVQLSESIIPSNHTMYHNVLLGEMTPGSLLQANPQHGLLIKVLAHHVDNLDVQRALQSYDQLKSLSGNNDHGSQAGTTLDSEATSRTLSSRVMDLRFLIPSNLFANLLNLVTGSRLFQTGQRLIEPFVSDRNSGSASRPRQSTALSAAITQFAGASSNAEMLTQLRDGINFDPQSMDPEALRELFHLEISANNWSLAKRLLAAMTQLRAMQILPDDITRIAQRIIRLDPSHNKLHVDNLMELLVEISSGQYRALQSSGAAPYWKEPRQLNQLVQVLVSIPDDRFSALKPLIIREGQLSNPIKIPTSAFNILLEAVVDTYGMDIGESFVRTWCWTNLRGKNEPGDRHFYPFLPNIETLKILIEPFTRRYQSAYIQREIFTSTGAPGKDAHILKSLSLGSANIRSTYETILGYYYRKYGKDLLTIFWAMDVCKAWKLDQGNTFYSLLQPMEVADLNPSKTAKPSLPLSGTSD